MKHNTGIYQIVNLVNGKRYIGSAVNLEQRKISHFNTLVMKIHKNKHFQYAYNKYGKEKFNFEIILYCSKENLLFYEQKVIDSYNLKKELYNISPTAGSNLGVKFTQEHKNKISLSNKGKKRSEECIEKMSNSLKGRTISPESVKKTADKLRGRKRPIDVRKKISEALTGKKLSKSHIAKISETHRGKKLSIEHRNKISQALTGRKLSEKNKRNIGISNTKKITDVQIEEMLKLRSEGISFRKIAKIFNYSRETIRNNLKKRIP